ncbi:MAG: P-loop NTPase [Pseudomonadota bacterium]
MDTAVIAGISHKGGTGRSVTLANLAFQLHHKELSNVCLVDLDLASPTMGAILQIRGLRQGQGTPGKRGNPKSVHDILVNRDDPTPAIVDVRTRSETIANKHRSDKQFGFIPGLAAGGDWAQKLQALRTSLRQLLERLRSSNYDFIVLDIRSGLSDVLEAIKHESSDLVDMLLVHTRWTPQHIIGLDSLLKSERVTSFGPDKVRIIRTAYIDPKLEPKSIRSFVDGVEAELQDQFEAIEWFGKPLSLKRNPFMGSIPMDPKLRWKETVLTSGDGASEPAYTVFGELASKIASEVRS